MNLGDEQLGFDIALERVDSSAQTYAETPEDARRSVSTVVYGLPVPQGNMTAQRKRKGPGVVLYHGNEDKLMPWRDSIVWALRNEWRNEPIRGAAGVHVVFTMRKPKSAPKLKHSWPIKKPDLDKLLRAVFDAITAAGVWVDDAQVVMSTMSKHYTGDGHANVLSTPGAVIHIWEV